MSGNERSRYEQRVRRLEAFGHRGSATDNERQAAEWLVQELKAAGLAAELQPFRGGTSMGARLVTYIVVSLGAAALGFVHPLASLAVGLVSALGFIVESTGLRMVLGSPFVRSPSRNVVATLAPATPARRRLVLMAHFDTQRTGLIWSDALGQRAARRLVKAPGFLKQPLLPVLFAMWLVPVAAALAYLAPGHGLVHAALGTAILILVVAAGLVGNWAMGPFVPGASDNASGTAAVLALAERFRQSPVPDVEIVCVLTGCEESGLLGSAAWVKRESESANRIPTVFLNIDTLGYGATRYLSGEYSLAGVPARYPADLVALTGEVFRAEALADASPHDLPVCSDGLPLLVRGLRGMTLLGFQDDGCMPNYHQPSDTSAHMNFDVAWQSVEVAWKLAQRFATAEANR